MVGVRVKKRVSGGRRGDDGEYKRINWPLTDKEEK